MRGRDALAAIAAVILFVALCIALLTVGWPAAADDAVILVRTPTDRYQLDTGDWVRWWIDDTRGLLCTALYRYNGVPVGVSCVPLDQTTYGWPAMLP